MQRIAIVGEAHSGKTTLATALTDNHNFIRLALADPVKDVSAIMLNDFTRYLGASTSVGHIDRAYINAHKGHPSIRKLLQLVGTELGREWLGPQDIWIDTFLKTVENETQSIVCDDCRFTNEAAKLRENGFVIIRLLRNEQARLESIQGSRKLTEGELEAILNHPSEKELKDIVSDYQIASVSTEQLRTVVAADIASGMYGKRISA